MANRHLIVTLVVLLFSTFATPAAWAIYSPNSGRFMQRDPMGYVDGPSVYETLKSNPIRYVDPAGTQSGSPGRFLNNQEKFVQHYFFGKGVFDLSVQGLLGDYQNKAATKAAVASIKSEALSKLRDKRWGVSCNPGSLKWSYTASRSTDVTWSDMFSLGRGRLSAKISCNVGVGSCVCCNGDLYPTKWGGWCSITFTYNDSFRDPLDIEQIYEKFTLGPTISTTTSGGFPILIVGLPRPASELPGGTPYAIAGSWTDSVSDGGEIHTPCVW